MNTSEHTNAAPSVARIRPLKARVGLLGIGHHIYWPQFDGLLDEIHRKIGVLQGLIENNEVEVANFGMIDNAQVAYDAIPTIKAADIDLLFVDMATYGTSSTFGVLCREINVPIVLVALQPLEAMDYPNGTTYMQLCNDDFCSVPEFTGVAIRFGRKAPPVILGHENNDPIALEEINKWCRIAKVLHSLRTSRIGLMGHVLESMLDMHTDPTALTASFGPHVVAVEPEDLFKHYESPDQAAVARWKQQILEFFDTPDPKSDPLTEKLTDQDLENAAKAGVALEGLIKDKNIDGFAYYYEAKPGSELRTLVTNLIVANSLLTGGGFPMCGEYDLKTCIAMMIMDRLDIGGSFAEFHPIDFQQDSVLVGHDGPHHINIAANKPVIRSLKKYHGKPGSGAGVEFQIKTGPITMLSIGQTAAGKFKFIIAEGESADRPIPPTGNTNTHGVFKPDVRTFLKRWCTEGPTHHFALGIGHHADTLIEIAEALNIEYTVTTP
ncbi:L-fucose/L-arabinose isomerase family protein [Coraliomargarita algicola]|uniref:L-fucose/L-arabinose isomerase family protein n=1 Tax=Coraliomargarita algicola TaxID=3092156 RepID=A0ABZ0RP03_9BACT|nr:L-fucose/L-arabinose isomerase family protein [Coraliomargarita sp. J2-16]WPJ97143.1 L-fucose/L-arabinose isomerase family protein [Coraliomargarita sp. J2-16]